ncbi:MAG: hypothetical protein WBD55_01340 [Dehalococcoidia bacterium]
MSQHLRPVGAESMPRPEWQEALDELEQSLHQALRAIALLRHELERGNRGAPAQVPSTSAMPSSQYQAPRSGPPPNNESLQPEMDVPAASLGSAPASFDRLWDRVEQEQREKHEQGSAQGRPPAQGKDPGLAGLPQSYLMTVEDREGKVDLIPLHRALSNLSNVEEVSLASYANGVPVISLRAAGELNLDELGSAVSTEMDRECEVIPQDTGKIYLRMQAWRE